ncbi:MAG TPA: hypothetical protein VFQ44_16255 [Streptosporangiaceae bacterium]|nr:hypothetical protein [Streptosporangiaceae bacterium]
MKVEVEQVIIGSDLSHYDSIASALGSSYNFTGIRYYAGGGGKNVNVFPTPWPIYGPRTNMLMSVYPDLRELLAGRLDNQIRDMIAGAPAGSMLTAWHEVLSLHYQPRYLTPANVYLMHRRMNVLCRGSNVTYGCLLGGGDLARLMRYVPPNLGFYGIDLYGNLGTRTHPRWHHPFDRWIQFRDLARTKDKVHRYPRLVIGETNCPVRSLRPAWFKLITSWLHAYGTHGKGVFTFWSDSAHLGGPWIPGDEATINALRGICSRYASK